jgi:hypothetical protein
VGDAELSREFGVRVDVHSHGLEAGCQDRFRLRAGERGRFEGGTVCAPRGDEDREHRPLADAGSGSRGGQIRVPLDGGPGGQLAEHDHGEHHDAARQQPATGATGCL